MSWRAAAIVLALMAIGLAITLAVTRPARYACVSHDGQRICGVLVP